jgi:hypothetical protein
MIAIIVLVFLLILIFGALPSWPYMSGYGYGYWPSGIFFVILLVLVLLFFGGGLGAYHW